MKRFYLLSRYIFFETIHSFFDIQLQKLSVFALRTKWVNSQKAQDRTSFWMAFVRSIELNETGFKRYNADGSLFLDGGSNHIVVKY